MLLPLLLLLRRRLLRPLLLLLPLLLLRLLLRLLLLLPLLLLLLLLRHWMLPASSDASRGFREWLNSKSIEKKLLRSLRCRHGIGDCLRRVRFSDTQLLESDDEVEGGGSFDSGVVESSRSMQNDWREGCTVDHLFRMVDLIHPS